MATARYYAIVQPSAPEARQRAERRGWWIDEKVSESAPGSTEVICLDQEIRGMDEFPIRANLLRSQLSDHGLEAIGMVGRPLGDEETFGAAAPLWVDTAMNIVGSGEGGGVLGTIVGMMTPGVPQSPTTGTGKSPEPPPPKDTPPDKSKEEGEAGKEEKKDDEAAGKKAASSSSCCEAETITAALGAFADPTGIWAWAGSGERGEVARELLPEIYKDRSRVAQRTEWLLAPEMVLLDKCPPDKQEELAERLLRVRGKLTAADVALRGSRAGLASRKVGLAGKEIELAATRVQLAQKGVGLADEVHEHMKKWRSIADWGIGFLFATTIFSMLAVGYVLLYLMPGNKVSDVAAPIIVFVLTLFAISPAVLLLRERPLEGIDKWFPGGAAEDGGKGEGDGKGSAKGKGDAPSSDAGKT